MRYRAIVQNPEQFRNGEKGESKTLQIRKHEDPQLLGCSKTFEGLYLKAPNIYFRETFLSQIKNR